MPSLFLALAVAASVFTLSGVQVTSSTAAPRLLGRLFAAMIEIDRWLPVHRDDIQTLARERERGLIVLDDLPVQVRLRASDVAGASDATVKRLVRAEAGEILYREGLHAFRARENGGNLPIDHPSRWTIWLFGEAAHSVWRGAMYFAATATALLALVALLSTSGSRLRALAGPAALGAGAAMLTAGAFWLLMTAVASSMSSVLGRELALIYRDAAWVGLRNGFAVLVVALAFLITSSLVGSSAESDRSWPGESDDVR